MDEVFEKTTKSAQVKTHLINEGEIDSWTAINRYGATRLSAIIYNLRRRGMNIVSHPLTSKDRNNNLCQFVKYIFIAEPKLSITDGAQSNTSEKNVKKMGIEDLSNNDDATQSKLSVTDGTSKTTPIKNNKKESGEHLSPNTQETTGSFTLKNPKRILSTDFFYILSKGFLGIINKKKR